MRKRGLCRSERDHTDRRVGREMYDKTVLPRPTWTTEG